MNTKYLIFIIKIYLQTEKLNINIYLNYKKNFYYKVYKIYKYYLKIFLY